MPNWTESIASEGFKLIKELLYDNWADRNDISYNYIISWFAGLITNLTSINKVALIMVSEQGSGKGTFVEFMEYILRPSNVTAVSGIESVTGKFNTVLQNMRLVILNELSSTRDEFRNSFEKFKMLVTDPTIMIENKGIKPYKINNISNFLGCTNNRDCIPFASDDRRTAVFEMSKRNLNNVDYFAIIRKKCFNQEVANEFFTYLLQFPAVPLNPIPQTNMRREMMDLSKPNPLKFLDWIREDDDNQIQLSIENGRVKSSDFYNVYKSWCETNGERCFTNTKFGTVISTKLQKIRSNGTHYIL